MPNAATHILIPIILIDLVRDYILKDKKSITTNHLLIAGIAGILPDIDVALGLVMTALAGTSPFIYHRLITHSAIIPLIIFLITITASHLKKKASYKISLMIATGYSIHLVLDFLLIGTIMPLYPFSTHEIGLNIVSGANSGVLMLGLDTAILLAWLVHEQMKHRIIDYI